MKLSGRLQTILLIAFFLSGACALIYEVTWQRMLVIIFGTTTFATVTILVSFMGGLALGSFFFGRLVDRYQEPLKLYAYLEAGIGVFALIFPFIISSVTATYIGIYQNTRASFLIFSLLKFLLCFLVLIIPTFLMGGTLPVISKLFVRKLGELSGKVGSLYASNTFGAVMGAFSAGFLLIPVLGVKQTTYTAAMANILIAAFAFILSRFIINREPENVPVQATKPRGKGKTVADTPAYPGHLLQIVLFVYALSGFCALAYEVLWTRILVFFFHSTTYAFTIMLTTFLFGLALGSMLFNKLVGKNKNLLILLVLIEIIIGFFSLLSMWEFSQLDVLMRKVSDSYNFLSFTVARYIGAFLIMFVPTLLMGIAFPLVSKIYTQQRENLGRSLGNVYSANTFGSVLGSLIAGFVIIPLVGVTKGIILIAIFNSVLGMIILFSMSLRTRLKASGLVCATAVMTITLLLVPKNQPLTLYSPVYGDLRFGGNVLFYKEDIGVTVTVHQLPADPFDSGVYRILEVDGVNVAGTHPMLRLTQKLQGHLPLLLYKSSTGMNPKNVFILGLASGESSYSITRHDIERLDCLEIVSAEKEAVTYFNEVNKDILNNPKFHLTIDDARNYLLATDRIYDVIESDTTHPEISADLFTEEYFEQAAKKLSPNGILSTWLPLYNTSEETFKLLIATFHSVFPHVSIWYSTNFPTRHALLVGSKTELKIDFQLLQNELKNERIKGSLTEVGLEDIFTLLGCFITDESRIGDYVADALINTDNRPYLAYLNPRLKLPDNQIIPKLLDLFSSLSAPVFPHLTGMGDAEDEIKEALMNYLNARDHVMRAIAAEYRTDFKVEVLELEQALLIRPQDTNIKYSLQLAKAKLRSSYLILGTRLYYAGRLEEAAQVYSDLVKFEPGFAPAHYNLGGLYYNMSSYDQAIAELLTAITLEPAYIDARYLLATIYSTRGKYNEARGQLLEILKLEPGNELAKKALDRLR